MKGFYISKERLLCKNLPCLYGSLSFIQKPRRTDASLVFGVGASVIVGRVEGHNDRTDRDRDLQDQTVEIIETKQDRVPGDELSPSICSS